jgi:hypothetical protein
MRLTSLKSWAAGIVAAAMIAYFSGLASDAGTVYCYIGPPPPPAPSLFERLHLFWVILAFVAPGVMIGLIACSNYLRVAVFSYLVGIQWLLVRIYRDLQAAKVALPSWSDILWQSAVIQTVMLLFGIAMAFIGFRITRRLTIGSSDRGAPSSVGQGGSRYWGKSASLGGGVTPRRSTSHKVSGMAQFIHLAAENHRRSIQSNGIRAARTRRPVGVYAYPQTENFVVNHQWMRELRRFRGTTIIAVRFRISDTEPVSIGKFNSDHIVVAASQAVGIARDHVDPLGPRSHNLTLNPCKRSEVYLCATEGSRLAILSCRKGSETVWLPVLPTR